jgi:PDZ domain-containing protein
VSAKVLVALIVAAVVGLALDVAGGAYAYSQAKNYYTIAPGSAPVVSADESCPASGPRALTLPNGKPCVRLVLPAGKAHPIQGSIMMVDVLVGPTTPVEYVLNKLGLLHHFDNSAVLEPADSVLGGTPPSQLTCQNNQAMSSAQSSASVVALRQLGYQVKENDFGAQIVEVVPGTPAARAGIECNDLVTSVNGAAVHTSDDLGQQIRRLAPGSQVAITVRRQVSGKEKIVTLTGRLGSTPAIGNQPAAPNRAFLGIVSQTNLSYSFPYNVNVQVGDIGGPSAGLALTLGLLDSLSTGQLTGGLHIAATGTMDAQGNVGDVGGVAQKTVAVRQAGAQVFFVPPQELKAAQSESGHMKVYAVSTLRQALDDLQALGGHVPAPPKSQSA